MLYNAQSPLGSRGCIHPTTWVILIVLLIEHSSAVCSSEERGRKKIPSCNKRCFQCPVVLYRQLSFIVLGASFLHLFGSIFKMFNKEFSAPRQYIPFPLCKDWENQNSILARIFFKPFGPWRIRKHWGTRLNSIPFLFLCCVCDFQFNFQIYFKIHIWQQHQCTVLYSIVALFHDLIGCLKFSRAEHNFMQMSFRIS